MAGAHYTECGTHAGMLKTTLLSAKDIGGK